MKSHKSPLLNNSHFRKRLHSYMTHICANLFNNIYIIYRIVKYILFYKNTILARNNNKDLGNATYFKLKIIYQSYITDKIRRPLDSVLIFSILSSIPKPLLGNCGDKFLCEVWIICSKNDTF